MLAGEGLLLWPLCVWQYRDTKSPPFRQHFHFNTIDKMMVKIKLRASHNDNKSQERRTRVSQRKGIHLLKHIYMTNQND